MSLVSNGNVDNAIDQVMAAMAAGCQPTRNNVTNTHEMGQCSVEFTRSVETFAGMSMEHMGYVIFFEGRDVSQKFVEAHPEFSDEPSLKWMRLGPLDVELVAKINKAIENWDPQA